MVRKKQVQKEQDQQLKPKSSQSTLKTEQSLASLSTGEEEAIQAIINHAIEFNNKKSVSYLNMLDVLNSYDELIKTFNLPNDQNTKIYRRLLQIQREKGKNCMKDMPSLQQEESKVTLKEADSEYSTLNQDLQFDFQGSFGILNRRASNQSMHNRTNSNEAYSKFHRDSSKSIPRATPTLMNSQFQSLASLNQPNGLGENIKISEYITQKSGDQLLDMKLLNQKPPLHQSQSSTQVLRQQPSLSSDGSRGLGVIKLPKLSFNDLIQAQNYDSYKKVAQNHHQDSTDLISLEEKKGQDSFRDSQSMGVPERLVQQEYISDEEEELKSHEISVFKSNAKHSDSLMRRSYELTTNYKQRREDPKDTLNSTHSIALKLPKLKLLSECQTLDELEEPSFNPFQPQAHDDIQPRQDVPKPIQRGKSTKENVIDDNSKLASAFQTRKYMLKAWKSWLIVKMHKIHTQHLNRLAYSFKEQRNRHKHLQHWKLYVKLILPEERVFKKASEFYKLALVKRVLTHMRQITQDQINTKAKLVSTRIVLRQQALRRNFEIFKRAVLGLQVRRTQKYTALHIKDQKLKALSLRALASWAHFRVRERLKNQRAIFQYQHALARTALQSMIVYWQARKHDQRKLFKARVYFKNHYASILKVKAFKIMKLFAVHNRKQKLALGQWRYWMMYRYFKSFKFFCYISRGAKTQNEFISRYSNHNIMLKVFKVLMWNRHESQSKTQLITNYLERLRLRKMFREFAYNREYRIIFSSLKHGPLIQCLQVILENSFGGFMESVWKEFPKQKISHQSDGRPNYLLNYLGLSKQPKYRKFFFQANEALLNHHKSKILKAWRHQTSIIKGFRRRLQRDQLKGFLRCWRQVIYRKCLLNKLVLNKQKKRFLSSLCSTFNALKDFRSNKKHLDKAYYKVLYKRKLRLVRTHMNKWHANYTKTRQIKTNEEIANKIYRHRGLTQYLAKWLKALHHQLKSQHLEIVKERFQKQLVRRRWLRKWHQEFQRHQYLQEQEQQICDHQTNLTVYRAFNKLWQYREHRQQKRHEEVAARQEYQYWLGKRALIYLQQGLQAIRSQKELYKNLEEENRTKTMRQCLNYLRLFTAFKQDQKAKDYLMTQQIRLIRKNRVMRQWQSKISQKLSCFMLDRTLKLAQLKRSFSKIIHYLSFQESVVEVMSNKQDAYSKLALFNLLKRNVKVSRSHNGIKSYLSQKTQAQNMRQSFKHWRKLYCQRKRAYKIYAFTVIQLKNQFLSGLMQDWKKHIALKRNKIRSLKYYTQKKKRSCFRDLKMNYLKSQRILASSDYLKSTLRLKSLTTLFSDWRTLYSQQIQVKQVQSQLEQSKVKRLFNGLKHLKQIKQQRRGYQIQKLIELNRRLLKIKFTKLRSLTQTMKQTKLKILEAREHHKQYLFKAACQIWFNYYKTNQTLISKLNKIQKNNKILKRKEFMKKWIDRSMKRITKVRALKKINKVANDRKVLKRFVIWVDQTNFLITLDQRIQSLQNKRDQKDKIYVVQKLSHYSTQRQLCKQRMLDVKDYTCKKSKIKAIIGLRRLVQYRQLRSQVKDQAFLQYCNSLKQRAFQMMSFILYQQIQLKHRAVVMNAKQRQLYGNEVYAKLIHFKQQQQARRTINQTALEFRVTQLYSKCIQAFLLNRQRSYIKKQLTNQARVHYGVGLIQKTLKTLSAYRSYRQVQTKKRSVLSQRVASVDSQYLITLAFNQFKQFSLQSKQEIQDQRKYLKHVKSKRLFQLMKFNYQIKSEHRQAYDQVTSKVQQRQKLSCYQVWRHSFVNEMKIKIQRQQQNGRIIAAWYQSAKASWQKSKIIKMINYEKNIKVKAQVLTAFIEFTQRHRMKTYYNQQALLQNNNRLAQYVFAGFAQAKLVRAKISQGNYNQAVSLVKRALRSFKLVIDRKYKCLEYQNLQDKRRVYDTLQLWSDKFDRKQKFKLWLSQQFMKFEDVDKRTSFTQWKRGAFFMKTCELIFTYRYKEEEDTMTQSVFLGWRKYTRLQRNKQFYSETIQQAQEERLLRTQFSTWMNRVKPRLLNLKLEKITQPKIQEAFYQILNYSDKEASLVYKSKKLSSRIEKKTKQRFFYEWMIRMEQREQVSIMANGKDLQLAKKALRALEINRLSKMESKYQMLRVIKFFSQRRPELLLTFSKVFLVLNNEHSATVDEDLQTKYARICSTALAKYVLEKWKNVKDVLQVQNDQARVSDQQYATSLVKKVFLGLREHVEIMESKKTLQVSCKEFHNVNLIKNVFYTLKLNWEKNISKRTLQENYENIREQQIFNSKVKFFQQWRLRFILEQRSRDFSMIREQKHYFIKVSQCLMAWKNYTIVKQNRRLKLDNARNQLADQQYVRLISQSFKILKQHTVNSSYDRQVKQAMRHQAECFYTYNIQKRTLTLLRQTTQDQKIKSKYSKLYSVFVAWKFYIKEKSLLKKYLNECNYQSQGKTSKSLQRSKPRTISYGQKENLFVGGQNESSLDFQVDKAQRYMSRDRYTLDRDQPLSEKEVLAPKILTKENIISEVQQQQMTPTLGSQFLKNQFQKMASKEGPKSHQSQEMNKGNSTLQIFKQRFYN